MRRTAGTIAGAVLGLVLLVGALTKAVDPRAFVEQIELKGLDIVLSAEAVMYLALALEAGLGLLLVSGVRQLWVLVSAAVLVVLFLTITGHVYWDATFGTAEVEQGCGCFGNLVTRTPAEAFWQDLLIMGPAAVLAFVGRGGHRGFPRRRIFASAMGVLAILLLAWRAPELPLDDLVTRLRPGVAIAELCAGAADDPYRLCLDALVPELDAGNHLVVIATLDDPRFESAVEEFNRYAEARIGPRLWVLSSDPEPVQHAFFWRWAPSFEVRETPEELLRPMVRSLPRSFQVRDGQVSRTFDEIPPLDQIAESAQTRSNSEVDER
jgi:hypothetical protein